MKLLREKQAAEILQCSPRTLRNHRCAGIGLPYLKIGGAVRYLEDDVLAALVLARVETKRA